MNDTLMCLLDDSNYLIVGFSNDELTYKNKRFDHYFNDVVTIGDFASKVVDYTHDDGVDIYFLQSPDDRGGIIKFEKTSYMSKVLLIGVKLDYDKVTSLIKHIEGSCSCMQEKSVKYIDFNKNKLKSYCTFVVDDSWIIKYFSDNVRDILGIDRPHLKSIKQVFGEDFDMAIREKICYLDVFNDMALECEDMLVVINKSEYGYLVINVYPYSGKVANKFDEIGELRYKVKQLQNELDRRKKVIDMQKAIIKSITKNLS